jgi:hypothetical protein
MRFLLLQPGHLGKLARQTLSQLNTPAAIKYNMNSMVNGPEDKSMVNGPEYKSMVNGPEYKRI